MRLENTIRVVLKYLDHLNEVIDNTAELDNVIFLENGKPET